MTKIFTLVLKMSSIFSFRYINKIIHHYIQFLLMEVEHPLFAEKTVLLVEPCIAQNQNKTSNEVGVETKTSISETSNDFCYLPESFKKLVEMGLPCNESVEEKLSWLRSQIIGHHAEFDSPFGRRKLLYADHTASGRSLHYNENFIIDHLLPFYDGIIANFSRQYIDTRTQANLSKLNVNRKRELDVVAEDMSNILERRRISETMRRLSNTPQQPASSIWGSPRLEVIAMKWTPIMIIVISSVALLWASLVLTDDYIFPS